MQWYSALQSESTVLRVGFTRAFFISENRFVFQKHLRLVGLLIGVFPLTCCMGSFTVDLVFRDVFCQCLGSVEAPHTIYGSCLLWGSCSVHSCPSPGSKWCSALRVSHVKNRVLLDKKLSKQKFQLWWFWAVAQTFPNEMPSLFCLLQQVWGCRSAVGVSCPVLCTCPQVMKLCRVSACSSLFGSSLRREHQGHVGMCYPAALQGSAEHSWALAWALQNAALPVNSLPKKIQMNFGRSLQKL